MIDPPAPEEPGTVSCASELSRPSAVSTVSSDSRRPDTRADTAASSSVSGRLALGCGLRLTAGPVPSRALLGRGLDWQHPETTVRAATAAQTCGRSGHEGEGRRPVDCRPVHPEVGPGPSVLPGELRGLGPLPGAPLRLEDGAVALQATPQPQLGRRLDPDPQRRPLVDGARA